LKKNKKNSCNLDMNDCKASKTLVGLTNEKFEYVRMYIWYM